MKKYYEEFGLSYDKDGRVIGPGKFEGETRVTVQFYAYTLEGGGDETVFNRDRPIDFFVVDDEDREILPELENVYGVAIMEDDNGFVYGFQMKTLEEYEEAKNANDNPEEEDMC